jgi:carbonic anhydrase
MTMAGDAAVYKAIQMHIHLGSEHRLDGVTLDAELHIVHQESGGYWHAVLAVLLEASEAVEDHALFGQWLDRWEAAAAGVLELCNSAKKSGEQRRLTRQLDDSNENDDGASFDLYYDLVPSGSSFYQYFGSLTIPPCSEDVFWTVADIPVTISTSQLERLAGLTLSYIDPELCLPATSASSKTNTTNRPPQSLNGRTVRRVCPGE